MTLVPATFDDATYTYDDAVALFDDGAVDISATIVPTPTPISNAVSVVVDRSPWPLLHNTGQPTNPVPLTYQWYLNGDAIVGATNNTVNLVGQGATVGDELSVI